MRLRQKYGEAAVRRRLARERGPAGPGEDPNRVPLGGGGGGGAATDANLVPIGQQVRPRAAGAGGWRLGPDAADLPPDLPVEQPGRAAAPAKRCQATQRRAIPRHAPPHHAMPCPNAARPGRRLCPAPPLPPSPRFRKRMSCGPRCRRARPSQMWNGGTNPS
jgi:hypothetical protein